MHVSVRIGRKGAGRVYKPVCVEAGRGHWISWS